MRGAALKTLPPVGDFHLHICFLLGSMLIVALAASMSVYGATQVRLPGVQMSLPELCYFRRNLGLDCPGCGLTRSFIALAHGQVALAWHYNPAGLLLFPLLAFQIPYQAAQLRRLRTGRRPWNLSAVTLGVIGASFLVMLAQWVIKMLPFWHY